MTNIAQYEVYIENFGAKGDGVNDDALALNAAIASMAATGGVIKLLPKKYYLKTAVLVNQQNISIEGVPGLSPYDYGAGGPMGTQLICTNGITGIEANNIGYFRLRYLNIYLATGATTATIGVKLVNCFNPKLEDVHVTNFSTAIYMHGNSDTYIDGCYLGSVGGSITPVIGIDLDSTSHVQNASSYISNTIAAAGSYASAAYGFYLHGNRINDTTFDTCETDGLTYGYFVDGTAGIDGGYAGDIHFVNCEADGYITYGFYIKNVPTDGTIDIDGGWAAGSGTGVYVSNSKGVNVRGLEALSGTNGIYYLQSSGDAIGNVIRYMTGYGLVADDSPGIGFISNKGFQNVAGASAFISLVNNSTRCRLIGNSVDPSSISGGYGTGISTAAGSDYIEVLGNDMPSPAVTTPFSLNLGTNTHTVRLDVDGTTIVGGSVPTATSSVLGICRPDNTTITVVGGVLTSASGALATSTTFGTVKPDNSTITISGGVISSTGGGGGSSGPTFSAYGTTSIPNTSLTKATFGTVEWDTASCFASSRFTPNVSGYYHISSQIFYAVATGRTIVSLFKNGTRYKDGNDLTTSGSFVGVNVDALVYLNGSTDYVEIYTYQSSGATQNAIDNSGISSYFTGFLASS